MPRRHLLAFSLLLAPLAVNAPAIAQDAPAEKGSLSALEIDPETATALVALGTVLRGACDRGQREACEMNGQLRELSDLIVASRAACARGSQRGCAMAERASKRVAEIYGRLDR